MDDSKIVKPEMMLFSILIPAYNEESSIGQVLDSLIKRLSLQNAEIIVINDGSLDRTNEIVRGFHGIRVITHRINKGYGSAIITGTLAAKGKYVFWFDADGQHQVDDLLKLMRAIQDNDLDYCIGIRDEKSYKEPNRVLGKLILKSAIRLLTGRKTRDFNSGMRGFRRDVLVRYLHLLPKGFGASTTTTLLMAERGYYGEEIPITVLKRKGKSTVNQFRDGFRTLRIISNILFLFKPFRFFSRVGFFFILLGSIYGVERALSLHQGVPILASLLIMLGVQAFFFGLISDQISAIRLEKMELLNNAENQTSNHENN